MHSCIVVRDQYNATSRLIAIVNLKQFDSWPITKSKEFFLKKISQFNFLTNEIQQSRMFLKAEGVWDFFKKIFGVNN